MSVKQWKLSMRWSYIVNKTNVLKGGIHMEMSVQAFLGLLGGGVEVVLTDLDELDKVYWKGTIDEYFKEEKRQYWWFTVQSAYVDNNSIVVIIHDEVK